MTSTTLNRHRIFPTTFSLSFYLEQLKRIRNDIQKSAAVAVSLKINARVEDEKCLQSSSILRHDFSYKQTICAVASNFKCVRRVKIRNESIEDDHDGFS